LDAATGAQQMPDHTLGARHGELAGVLAEDAFDGGRLGGVAEFGARAGGVDVLNVGGVQSRVAQGEFHCFAGAGPCGGAGGGGGGMWWGSGVEATPRISA